MVSTRREIIIIKDWRKDGSTWGNQKAFLEEVNGSENEAWDMDLISVCSDFKLTETPSSKNRMSKDIPETVWKGIGSESHDVKLHPIY